MNKDTEKKIRQDLQGRPEDPVIIHFRSLMETYGLSKGDAEKLLNIIGTGDGMGNWSVLKSNLNISERERSSAGPFVTGSKGKKQPRHRPPNEDFEG